MLRAAICSFMKLSIFTGDAFAPIFSKTKSPVARYNSISSTDCFSFLPFTGVRYPNRSRESPDCGSFGNEHFLRRLPFLHSGTLYQFVDASLTRRVIVRFCSCLPEPLSASFDIISILCSGSLLRHHTHQYAHRPLDAHYFGFGRHRHGFFFIRQRIKFRVLSCANLTFLLPRSTCIVSMFHGWISRG